MACAYDLLTASATQKTKLSRKSYTRGEKLTVIRIHEQNGCKLYTTCKKFNLNTKPVLRWWKDKEKVKESRGGSRWLKYYIHTKIEIDSATLSFTLHADV